ncbi:MAG: phosphoribosylformylglycinamidine cyclo-ligase [Methanomassiliicoccales archaeon]|nr:phosphoribosylformylglycinamidine cyclo-ligase [Methanomassiliicoccales archaeon]NYT15748.1 phosphoribosylformylglycinamidine cyclo-ligase [Methanomassiliicoccales archaeon]
MSRKGWTYAQSGVDIDRKSKAISTLVAQLAYRRKGRGTMVKAEGQFTGMIDFGDVLLTLCTDGVGTKLLVAETMGRWDTVGIDCIAMNVNDTIVVGAEPMAFVDYIAIDRPDEELTSQIGLGLERGAELANMDIVGGEIAVMPEVVNGVDISGTCLGFVPKEKVVNSDSIEVGDMIIGLPSSGIHSNGLTLARKIMASENVDYSEKPSVLERSVGEELLVPTEIYVRSVLKLLDSCQVRGMVNITGGGLRNFLRLKGGVSFEIEKPLDPKPIFSYLQDLGSVEDREMYQTFNMGMGFAIIVSEADSGTALEALGNDASIVGRVCEGNGVAIPQMAISYFEY